jgi:hypothetical protein
MGPYQRDARQLVDWQSRERPVQRATEQAIEGIGKPDQAVASFDAIDGEPVRVA